MSRRRVPLIAILLDVVGTVLLALGILPLAGVDFGHPVLVETAPALITLGVLLMLPLLAWAVRQGLGRRR